MKPGNLLSQGAKSGGRRKMRIRFTHIESSVCGFLFRTSSKNLSQLSSRSFRATPHDRNLEIHKVFLRLLSFDLHENLLLSS